jgi:hypothetical protein
MFKKVHLIGSLTALVAALAISTTSAQEQVSIGAVEMPSANNSAAFKEVKKLLGRWEGMMRQSISDRDIPVSYELKLTSGGNTIVETLVEDGVEMLTTYTDKGGELVVTHYCSLGTEPIFKVAEMSDGALTVRLDDKANNFHAGHDSYVTEMAWIFDASDSNVLVNTGKILMEGELVENYARLTRVK